MDFKRQSCLHLPFVCQFNPEIRTDESNQFRSDDCKNAT